PAVDHVVDDVNVSASARLLGLARHESLLAADGCIPCPVKCPEVSIERIAAGSRFLIDRREFATNERSITMRTFGMKRAIQALGDDRVLDGDVAGEGHRKCLIHSPGGRDVVENHSVAAADV